MGFQKDYFVRTLLARSKRLLIVTATIAIWSTSGDAIRASEQSLVVAAPSPIECQIEGTREDNFRYIAVQCWLPPSERIRNVLCVVLHPDGTNGRRLAHSAEWVALALAYDAALIGVSIVPSADATKMWFHADGGSGRGMLEAVESLAQMTGRDDLRQAPLLLTGVCAAGQFAYEFAGYDPSRVLGFATVGGAKHRLEAARLSATVTGLLVVTPDRGPGAAANLQALSMLGHLLGAPWHSVFGTMALYDAGGLDQSVPSFLRDRLAGEVSGATDHFRHRNWAPDAEAGAFAIWHIAPSFLGSPLPVAGNAESAVVGNDTDRGLRYSIRVRSTKANVTDHVFVPETIPGQAAISKVGDGEWQIDLLVEKERLPTGGFQFEVPVRFSNKGKSMLGGLQVPVSGTIVGDLYASPTSLRIDWTAAKQSSSVALASRGNFNISGIEIEAVVPTYMTARVDDTSPPRVIIAPKTLGELLPQTVAGYVIVRAKSNKTQKIKIPFYGTIKM